MAKSGKGKLSKLKGMIKRWHSSSRIARSAAVGRGGGGGGGSASSRSQDEDTWQSASFRIDEVPAGLHPVYVGKSRRRYLVSSDLVDRPLFQLLVEKSGGSGATMVGCEVVLFDHLLWMLENADPQPESLDEIFEFYAC